MKLPTGCSQHHFGIERISCPDPKRCLIKFHRAYPWAPSRFLAISDDLMCCYKKCIVFEWWFYNICRVENHWDAVRRWGIFKEKAFCFCYCGRHNVVIDLITLIVNYHPTVRICIRKPCDLPYNIDSDYNLKQSMKDSNLVICNLHHFWCFICQYGIQHALHCVLHFAEKCMN